MSVSESAKILGLFPLPSKSHMAVNVAIVKELAERGHVVTVVSPFPEKYEIPKYKNIVLDENVIEKHFATLGKKGLFSTVIVMTGDQEHTIISDDLNVPTQHNGKSIDLRLCHKYFPQHKSYLNVIQVPRSKKIIQYEFQQIAQ